MSLHTEMTKEDMRRGLLQGRTLIQEEWAGLQEDKWLDELIAEGIAEVVRPWGYSENFQCSYRKVRGIKP